MLPDEKLDLDHRDGGDGWSWSHASCNRAAGAARGNRMRAAAYRRQQGLPDPPKRPSGGRLSGTQGQREDDGHRPIVGTLHLIDGWTTGAPTDAED
ncbi:hypothetical protein [Streptomyces pseudovenezuelae]|uniref:hypothetical protein n=1 Tax=Streptomyces pseudovenezuelae TaxID=67350 RepID=UPI002E33A78F|nr:hypothetical protein [Streptomyces pseudovenezuelae]